MRTATELDGPVGTHDDDLLRSAAQVGVSPAVETKEMVIKPALKSGLNEFRDPLFRHHWKRLGGQAQRTPVPAHPVAGAGQDGGPGQAA
jgi:hypothetical protein